MRSGTIRHGQGGNALLHATLALAIVACLPVPAAAQAQAPSPQVAADYNIPARDLAGALDRFSTQSGIQIIYQPELVAGKQTQALIGRLGWRDALDALLRGSGLEYQQANAATVVIRRAEQAPERPTAEPAPSRQPAGAARQEAPAPDIQGMTVTGTRIRGGETPSPVVTIGIENIREEGFSDLGEVIRSVPQNFSGGQNPGVAAGATTGAGGIANQNITGGSGLNLRGLGPDATLTLLNGQRMSYGGFVQAVDISAIPVEAVDRIEIVADGASAIYGSDAVGGVGNVILKRDFQGVSVGTRYGTATDAGMTTREQNLTAGTTWATGGVIATFKHAKIDPINAADRDYTAHLFEPTTIYPGSRLRSGLLSAHQSLGASVELRLDMLRTERDQRYYSWYPGISAYYNDFAPETSTTLMSPMVNVALSRGWTLSLSGTLGKDEHNQYESSITAATGEVNLVTNDCYCNKSRVYEVSAEGPLFALPGGDARVAIGAGRRTNEWMQFNYVTDTANIQGNEGSRFGYAEIHLPLVAPDTPAAGFHRLALTAAVRGEDYDTFGNVATPKLGLIYGPSADITIKASWGRSFKAPTLWQRYGASPAFLVPPIWYGGVGYPAEATVLILGMGNPDLGAERARTSTASMAFHPETLPGLEAELTWFDIDYTDRVVQPITDYNVPILTWPAYAQFIQFSPPADRQAQVIAAADYFLNATGAPYDPANVVAIIDPRYVNASRQRIKGLDLTGSYRFDLRTGRLTFRGSASWLNSTQQIGVDQPSYDLAGVLYNPARLNSRFGAVWAQGGFTASTFANYTGGVTNTAEGEKTGSFTTIDATLRYAAEARAGRWPSWDIALSAQNLLNRWPPLHAAGDPSYWAPYDSTNYSAIGRFLSLSVAAHF
ncbi:TonB-dependent receptor [Luteimonas sp. BDR2-5]|uniref:TonB-dependent receptor n=1 Tax=Proluteimonas luteida TaxID=2878685 RepID=UPI001E491E5D|nr:TonB-dependent receptor [Luteimonas sp. BDR2-5]MCD9026728.1 TonB-dependent receptor [Luteimonas sp. BDR2-5]